MSRYNPGFRGTVTKPGKDAITKDGATKKVVGYWLLGCSGMVFVAVVLGGTVYYQVVGDSVEEVLEHVLYLTRK